MYSIDQTSDAIPINSIALEGSNLKLTVDAVQGTYAGKVSTDGNSIAGTWTQGAPLPLTLRRAAKETVRPLDPAAHTVQFITVDNDVKLEVLDWGGSGRPLVLLTGLGNNAYVHDRFALCDKSGRKKWVVYAKAPCGGPEQVLQHLARCAYRVAVSNDRLLFLEHGQVTFHWKDYADQT
jgi:hypothetical protein